jgi:hypothetical protein
LQPRLTAFVQVIQRWPSMTALPDEVATIVRVGMCNPNSAKQFGHRRDSKGAKPRQTGQGNARTVSSWHVGCPPGVGIDVKPATRRESWDAESAGRERPFRQPGEAVKGARGSCSIRSKPRPSARTE